MYTYLLGRDDLLLALQLHAHRRARHRLDHAVVALPRALGQLHHLTHHIVLPAAAAPTPTTPVGATPLAALAAVHPAAAAESAGVARASAEAIAERGAAAGVVELGGRLGHHEVVLGGDARGDGVVGAGVGVALVLGRTALARDDAHLDVSRDERG